MALDVDEFLHHIGQFGKFQKRTLCMFCFIFFPVTYQTLIMYFMAMEPPWQCTKTATTCNATGIFTPETQPRELYERRCTLKRSEWEFAESKYDGPQQTIVNEWDLVCDKGVLAWLASSMLFIGWTFGALVIGFISDKYGRRSVLFPCVATVIITGFLSSFSRQYWQMTLCRFIIGFAEGGAGLSMFVLATELVGPQKRALSGTLVWFYFTCALCVMGLLAYFIRNWRTFSIICTIPWLFVLVFWKFTPESIRWLMVKGKMNEAEKILHVVARVNKTHFPEGEKLKPVIEVKGRGFLELFRTRVMAVQTLILCYLWLVNGMVYYGVSYGATDLGGSLYLNFVLTSLVEIPGNYLVVHNCNKFGRKHTVVAHMVIGAVACVSVSAIPAGTNKVGYIAGRVAGALIGKMCITTSFNSLYVFSAELLPTVVRNSGMGLISVISRIGASSSPFIVEADRVHPILPFAVMGVLTLLGAFFCWFLPETRGMPTIEIFNQDDTYGFDDDDEVEEEEEIPMNQKVGFEDPISIEQRISSLEIRAPEPVLNGIMRGHRLPIETEIPPSLDDQYHQPHRNP